MMAFTPTLFATILASRDPETGLIQPPYTPAQVLHVKKTGNDTTGTGTFANPYLTINKAHSVLQPSGEIHVYRGTYSEFTRSNPFVPLQVYTQDVDAATAPRVSGTTAHPCVLRAAPGEEGLVIIDGGGVRAGLVTQAKNNWYIYGLRFENCMNAGIGSLGGATLTPTFANLSQSWTVENCLVKTVYSSDPGSNVSGIAPWGTKDWVITNCYVTDIRRHDSVGPPTPNRVSLMQTYGAINILIINCKGDNADYGWFAKDHFLYEDLVTPYKGATIDSCWFKTRGIPFYMGVRGAETAHAGETIVRNSIFHHTGVDNEFAGIYCDMGGALGQSESLTIDNCIIRATSGANTVGIQASGFASVRSRGNITIDTIVEIQMLNQGEATLLTECNRNAYATFNNARMNAFGTGNILFNWTAWRAATSGSPSTLGVSNPDSLSVLSTAGAMFVDMAADDYRFKVGSPTIGLGVGGTNAGPYQTNLEYIGLLPTYSAGV